MNIYYVTYVLRELIHGGSDATTDVIHESFITAENETIARNVIRITFQGAGVKAIAVTYVCKATEDE